MNSRWNTTYGNRVQRWVQKAAATPAAAWLLSKVLHFIDPLVVRYSHNKTSLTAIMSGIPVIELTARGAKSGKPRTVILLGVHDGEDMIVFATNFGQKEYPSWYYNVRANPEVTISYPDSDGEIYLREYVAREAREEEQEQYWRRATALYAGFGIYRERIKMRRVPILVLTPKKNS